MRIIEFFRKPYFIFSVRVSFLLFVLFGICFVTLGEIPLVSSQKKSIERKKEVANLKKGVDTVSVVSKEKSSYKSPTVSVSVTPISTPTKKQVVISSTIVPSTVPSITVTLIPTPTQQKAKVLSISTIESSLVSQTISPEPTITTDPNTDEIWEKIAECESHKNWSIDTGNGYFGGLQFSQGAWESVGGTGLPSLATREEQISRAKQLQQKRGWSVWGQCSKRLGLY